ncbi:MAG: response regulator [Cytophagales bacterium]|nr:response regulator [Cytophagales bacterium]
MKETKKKIVLVEDDADVMQCIKQVPILCSDEVEILEASNAGEAIELLFTNSSLETPDALILDLMMPYGDAKSRLDPNGSDSDGTETGVKLLEYFRQKEKDEGWYKRNPIWISVITARNAPHLVQNIRHMLDGNGRIYFKPFDEFMFEYDLAQVLGLKTRISIEFLPSEYEPPKQRIGGSDESSRI